VRRSYLSEEQGRRNWSGSVCPFSTWMHICKAQEISEDSRDISTAVWFITPAGCTLENLLFRGYVGRMSFILGCSIARLPDVFWKVFVNRISVVQDPLLRFHKYFMWGSRGAWWLEEEEQGRGFGTTAVAEVAVGKSIKKGQWDYSCFRNCQVALREGETPSEGLDKDLLDD